MGTIGWTGNYRFTFEVDNAGNLRVISGINPYASAYELKPNEWFVTPEFIFTLSNQGTGKASRDIHDWARNYQIKDGKGDRLTLLNNWESTGFNFNEKKLEELMKEAKHLGVDMFCWMMVGSLINTLVKTIRPDWAIGRLHTISCRTAFLIWCRPLKMPA